MSLHQANGTRVTKTGVDALHDPYVDPDPLVVLNAPIYEHYGHPGESGKSGRRLVYAAGQRVRLSEVNSRYPDAKIESISPATGPTAGNTLVTIRGENLEATSVTFGGTAATAVVVAPDKRSLKCRTPAKAAASVAVAVVTDAGTVTRAGGYTYA